MLLDRVAVEPVGVADAVEELLTVTVTEPPLLLRIELLPRKSDGARGLAAEDEGDPRGVSDHVTMARR